MLNSCTAAPSRSAFRLPTNLLPAHLLGLTRIFFLSLSLSLSLTSKLKHPCLLAMSVSMATPNSFQTTTLFRMREGSELISTLLAGRGPPLCAQLGKQSNRSMQKPIKRKTTGGCNKSAEGDRALLHRPSVLIGVFHTRTVWASACAPAISVWYRISAF